MKKNKILKYLLSTISVIFLILIGILIMFNIRYLNATQLTQLKNNSQSQMMGYVIKTKDDKLIVIDGGTQADTDNLITKIKKLGGAVDYWFVTHPHKDHAGAFIKIVNETDIKINHVYITINELSWYQKYEADRIEEVKKFYNAILNERIKENVEEVTLNQKIYIDNIECEILGIKNPEITTNAINNSSMVIKMFVNNKSILFLGDTGVESGEKLLKNQRNKLKADIVQAAHHGQNGVNKEIYEAINPKIVLWPTPDWLWNNDIGNGEDSGNWKTKETRTWLQELGVSTNIIEKDGDITIKIY